ncbi:MAG: FixH family protein [Pseudomonadota bacterium]|nr:FixH family protein [Pseudomonadota bacterium]
MTRYLAGLVTGFALLVATLATTPALADVTGLETVPSANGLYRVTIRPEQSPAGVGPIHAWIANVTDADGKPVEGADIAIDGGMPGHGHGLPTAPAMTDVLAPGEYRIDGVKFSMTGAWELRLAIEAPAGADTAVFSFTVD